jgi:hypothetical protein
MDLAALPLWILTAMGGLQLAGIAARPEAPEEVPGAGSGTARATTDVALLSVV